MKSLLTNSSFDFFDQRVLITALRAVSVPRWDELSAGKAPNLLLAGQIDQAAEQGTQIICFSRNLHGAILPQPADAGLPQVLRCVVEAERALVDRYGPTLMNWAPAAGGNQGSTMFG